MAAVSAFNAFAKTLVRLAGPALAYWATHGGPNIFDHERDAPTQPANLGKVTVIYGRHSALAELDDAEMFSLYFLNVTDGDVDNSWTAQDWTNLFIYIKGFAEALFPLQTTHLHLQELRGHLFPVDGNPGQFVAQQIINNENGTSGALALPQQVAMSLTLETPSRKHWGRIYIPGLSATCLDDYGRWLPAKMQTVADAATQLMNDVTSVGFFPVVYSRVSHSALGVSGLRVDDIPDVIRRRRVKRAISRILVP